jgi:hypothetical protein
MDSSPWGPRKEAEHVQRNASRENTTEGVIVREGTLYGTCVPVKNRDSDDGNSRNNSNRRLGNTSEYRPAGTSDVFVPTSRTRVRRHPERARYERQTIYDILDQAFVCHVAFISEGTPFVIPTNYVRVGDTLYLHGSTGSRMMKALAGGALFSLCVTVLDGIVFAPTALGHSLNYRSVVVLGKAKVIKEVDAKVNAMREFVEYVAHGRWPTVRAPTASDIARTMILAVPLVEASAKVRTGFATDSQEEYLEGTWTGVLPLQLTPGEPIPDPRGDRSISVPHNIRHYSRPQ